MSNNKKEVWVWNLDGTLNSKHDSLGEAARYLGFAFENSLTFSISKGYVAKKKYVCSFDGVFPGLPSRKQGERGKKPVIVTNTRTGEIIPTDSVQEAARIANCSPATIVQAIKKGTVIKYEFTAVYDK
jgi:hypothetical protein